MKRSIKTTNILFILIGFLCMVLSKVIFGMLPYILGVAMILVGADLILIYFQEKKYIDGFSEHLALGLMILVMAIAFLIKGTDAIGAIGTTWSIIGLIKAARSLDTVIKSIYQKKKYFFAACEAFVRISLSLILFFDPIDHMSKHIFIFGFYLVFIHLPIPFNKDQFCSEV